jgi:murein DD-endopeptidase MepM/ murein hydrolase activator NlpD
MARPIDIELNDSTPGIGATAERLRADVARRRDQRDEGTAELVKQIDEAARQKAEDKAARGLAERLRLAAAEQARRLVEEAARHAAETQARLAAAEEARRQAAEQAKREEEEARQRAAEERKRKAAEKKAREEAREKARLEAEERDRQAIQERLRKRREQQRRVIWPLVLGVVLPLVLGFLFLQFYGFDGRRAEFENTASRLFGVPVKVGSARLTLLPGPQWQMHDVVAGSGADTVRIAQVGIGTSLPGIFGTPTLETIHLDRPQLPPAVALKLLEQTSDPVLLKSGELRVTGLVFGAGMKDLPPLNLRASFRDGRLNAISGQGESPEAGKITLDLAWENQWQLVLNASQLRWMLGAEVPLTEVTVKGTLIPGGLQIAEFSAGLFAGDLRGSGRLGWETGWRLNAKLAAKLIDASKVAKAWIREGGVGGSATLVAEAPGPKELLPRASLSGSLVIERGVLGGVDLDKVLQERGIGEETRFESLNGDFIMESRRIDFSSLTLMARDLKANGSLGIDANRAAAGRVVVEARSSGARRTASLRISGSATTPSYQR